MMPVEARGTSWECHILRIGLEKGGTLHGRGSRRNDPLPIVNPWLVTRALEEATPLVERLERMGVSAAALPCIERRAIAWTPDPSVWAGRRTIFMVTSPYGARRLVDCWPQIKGHGVVAALTPATAAPLNSAGIAVEIHGTGGAVGLAKAIAALPESKGAVIVWLSSAAGLVEPEQEQAAGLLRGIGDLQRIVVYETRSPPDLSEQLSNWHGKRASAVFFSPSACRNFLQARAASGTGPVLERIACVGQSTLRSWTQLRPRGWPAAVYNADEEAFVAFATSQR
jgi:uroporphyrinogen-III synthase